MLLDNDFRKSTQARESLMVFCLLDRVVPYPRVELTWKNLKKAGMVTRRWVFKHGYKKLHKVIKDSGYRLHNQAAQNIWAFAHNPIDIRRSTRNELVKGIRGIGMKLASLYRREQGDEQVAVLDVHIKRWLDEQGLLSNSYEESEKNFLRCAQELGVSPRDLDLWIWNDRRVKPNGGTE